MRSHPKSFGLNGPNGPVSTKPKNKPKSKLWINSRKEYQRSVACMRSSSLPDKELPLKNINSGQSSAKIVNNSAAKGVSMSNHVVERTSKGTKQTTTSIRNRCVSVEISVDNQKGLSRSTVVGEAKLKEPHAERKGEVNDASQPTSLKAMPGLVPNTNDRLGPYNDSASRRNKQASSDVDITSATYSSTKLEFTMGIHMDSKDIHMDSKDSYTIADKDTQDEIMIDNDKENMRFGEYHQEGDTTKAKPTLDTLSDIHCNLGSISSDPFGRDLPTFQRDQSMNLTLGNVEKTGLAEINMGQFANCNEKDSNSMSKKRKEPSFEENLRALDDDSNVGVQVDNMSCKQTRKLKQSRVARKDEVEDGSGDLNHVGLEDDTASILKNDQAKVSMSSCVERQCYSCSKPIDKPIWSGILKTDDKKYVSLDGHLSTKSCKKAWNFSRQLLKVVEVKKLLRLEVWPKAWEVSTPTSHDIGIYFFPHEMRQDEGLDQLVREVMQNDLALRAIIGEAEMLIFPSIILPNHHQTFQGKHYLWGVFKRREGAVVEESLNVVGRCEIENQQNVVSDWPNHMLPGEEANQEMIQMASVVPLETHMFPPNKSTQEVLASHLKWPINKGFDLKSPGEEGAQAEATPVTTDAATLLANHGQLNPSMGHTADRLMGFVVQKTPKLDRIIRELEAEGALVFAMQGEMVGVGSWAGSKATATKK